MCIQWIEVIESLGIIVASIAAIWGINAWRRETIWKRKHELAEDVLAYFYEARENIEAIRSPFGYSGEGESRTKLKNETPEQTKIYNRAYAVQERYDRNKEAIERLRVLRFRFVAIFGKEYDDLFVRLNRVVSNIFFATNEVVRITLGEYGEVIDEDLMKDLRNYRKAIYSRSKEDEVRDEVDAIVSKAEKVCGRILQRKF